LENISRSNKSEFQAVNSSKLNELQRLVEDLVINKVMLEDIKAEVLNKRHSEVLEQEIRIISNIQDTVKQMSKVKMRNIYSSISNLVAKYREKLNQAIELSLEGEEEEIDCSVFDLVNEIVSYFTELAINDSSKKIILKAVSDNKNLIITIDSNNKNIDFDKISKTMKKEYLDIVSINEDKNITVILPVTSSITKAQLVTVCNQTYAIALEFIETIINKDSVEIKNTNGTQIIIYMGRVLPLINVRARLNLKSDQESSNCILVVKSGNHTAALLVDDILDQTDVVIRQKPTVINGILEFNGTTILGDGVVTLVLDVTSLIVKR
jgi:two-component system, chemotaxis family, sensor kinase CheA